MWVFAILIMAHITYKNITGDKVPSVTTILGRFKDSGGLIRWSNAEGLKGNKYNDIMKKHQDIGTSLHELAEMHILNHYYEYPQDETVRNCFEKFLLCKGDIFKNIIAVINLILSKSNPSLINHFSYSFLNWDNSLGTLKL